MSRSCGECSECCTACGITEIDKLPGTACAYDCGGCTLYDKPERPKPCVDFECAWLRGLGDEEDRPDKSGVILSVSELNGGTWTFALERHSGAIFGSGSNMINAVAQAIPLPIIVSLNESKYPDDKGDLVVLRPDLEPRATRMTGDYVGNINPDLKVFKIKPVEM